uniref:Myb-like domain-containing protein n=1 Tax=Brassica oleracea var. oleracea TaxID=109376 RepID=A0A0D3BKX6_BRAOL
MDPFSLNSPGFVNLLTSQSSQPIDLGCSEVPKPAERRKWTTKEDVVLISAWLNTSKDPIVSNEQKAGAFWKRIEEYVNASPLLVGSVPREWSQCKQRWGRVNEQVCKFVGSHEAALKEQASGQNENDVMKAAHNIFFNDYHAKFTLEHCWRELRFDQKWRLHSLSREGAKEKRKEPAEEVAAEEDVRPPGIKASKASKRKKHGNEAAFDQIESILAAKNHISKQKILDRLLAKNEDKLSAQEVTGCRWMRVEVDACKIVSVSACRCRNGLSPLQKCTAAIRMLAYGQSGDTYDEYLRLGDSTSRLCLENFTDAIIQLFGDEYLRSPTPEDLQRLLDVGEVRGFPGMIGSIDCMHWEWKNCPTAWKGQFTRGSGKPTIVLEAVASQDLWIWHTFFGLPGTLNEINVLDRSPIFDDILHGRAPKVKFKVNNHTYRMAYYLTDEIYPNLSTFIQSIPLPQGPKAEKFAEKQESARKDVERAFGVLQSRFAIVKNPALRKR